jgi:hypothetical protein
VVCGQLVLGQDDVQHDFWHHQKLGQTISFILSPKIANFIEKSSRNDKFFKPTSNKNFEVLGQKRPFLFYWEFLLGANGNVSLYRDNQKGAPTVHKLVIFVQQLLPEFWEI